MHRLSSLRTYEQNGKTNGGAVTDPTNAGSLADLLEGDSTTPGGYVSLPVCSADFALDNWRHHGARPDGMKHWPCDTWPSPDTCEISSFENETSDGSPLIKDCLQIVDNIKGTQGSWDVMTTSLAQHKIASAGSCRFGAKARNQRGNVVFTVGAQDVVDIITEAVSMYGSNGKIGAQGNMACDGNVNSQDMNWGIY